jgi:hypothetical protein
MTSKTTGEQIGALEFYPSRMLVSRIIKKGLHPYTSRSVIKFLEEKSFQPLYRKYEDLMNEKGSLPIDVLRSEAEVCAKMINRAEMKLCGGPVEASVQTWEEPKTS